MGKMLTDPVWKSAKQHGPHSDFGGRNWENLCLKEQMILFLIWNVSSFWRGCSKQEDFEHTAVSRRLWIQSGLCFGVINCENFGCRRQLVDPSWDMSSAACKEVLASRGKTQAPGSWKGSAKIVLKMERQPERLPKDRAHRVGDRANFPLWFTRNQLHVLSKYLRSCLTSCREIWACSSWMLLVATGLSSISLWAPSISSWRCCISCSYCSYCTTASFEREKTATRLSFYISNYRNHSVLLSIVLTGIYLCV